MESFNKSFAKIVSFFEGFTNLDDVLWTPMMEHAVKVIYLLAEHPDAISAQILQSVTNILKTNTVSCKFINFEEI